MRIDAQTRLCAVIGNPVGHSLSPVMHNAAFQAVGLNYIYLAFCVEDIKNCLAGMRALPNFRGMSVTIPHKIAVMDYLDVIDPLAKSVGCVNTITQNDGCLTGTITDGLGTLRAFKQAGVSIRGKRVLFLGSGGAVRAVAFAVAQFANADAITILGRTPEHVDKLVRDMQECVSTPILAGYLPGHLHRALSDHEIIVQGTPMGMLGQNEGKSPIPGGWLSPDHIVFDMVYRPRKTRLVLDAEAMGCKIVPGLEMLIEQAALQFESWTGIPAPREVMRAALQSEFDELSSSSQEPS